MSTQMGDPEPKIPVDYRSAPVKKPRRQYLDIPLGRNRKWAGFIGFVLIFAAVAGVLVWVFARFTSSLPLAVLLVTFLVSYMLLMGWWTSRNIERRDEQR